jgi:hypothetical protein
MVDGAGERSGVVAAMIGVPPRHVLTACLDSFAVWLAARLLKLSAKERL